MNIKCILEAVENPKSLPQHYLPDNLSDENSDAFSCFDDLQQIVDSVNKDGCVLFQDLFSDLLEQQDFEIRVIATQGIPEPYDAWFIEEDKVILFNLSLWSDESLCEYGKSVLIHEISHFLLHQIIPRPYNMDNLFSDNEELIKAMEYHVFDEGIAHFCAYQDKLDYFFSVHADKEKLANDAYDTAMETFRNKDLSNEDKEEVLQMAFAGNFWEKFGDITGLFRTARIYQESGVGGVKDYLKENIKALR